MRANEFLIERWTRATVTSYFDNKKQPQFSQRDVKVSKPFDGCVLLQYKTVPDLARSFFRVAEYYDGQHYSGKGGQVTLIDFLDQWMDRDGDVDYFKFWDGFNIPDHAFHSWLKSARPLSQAEQVLVDAVEKATKGMKKFCIIGVGSQDPATLKHEMFHARYYLDSDFKQAADQLLKDHAGDPAVKTIKKTLTKKLDYTDHVAEEVGAYLYAGSQLKLVFGVEAQDLVKLFQGLDTNMKSEKKRTDEVITVPTVAKGKREHLDVMPNDGRPIPQGQESQYMGKKIGHLGSAEVWTYNQGPMRTFVAYDPETRISQLAVTGSRYPENPDSFIVKGVYSGPRNSTRAADLYAWLVRELGLTLISDRKQSPGGLRVWQELEQRYGRSVNVYAYNVRTNQPINTGTDDPESTHGTRGDTAQNVRLVAAPK